MLASKSWSDPFSPPSSINEGSTPDFCDESSESSWIHGVMICRLNSRKVVSNLHHSSLLVGLENDQLE
jgi:hypothetical protein